MAKESALITPAEVRERLTEVRAKLDFLRGSL